MHPPRLNLQYAPAVRKGRAGRASFKEGGWWPHMGNLSYFESHLNIAPWYVGIKKANARTKK